jgi:hypothetical protein
VALNQLLVEKNLPEKQFALSESISDPDSIYVKIKIFYRGLR